MLYLNPECVLTFPVVRSYHRRLVQEASCDRWPIMHVGGSRYSWTRRIYCSTRPMDPRWRGLRPRLQHFLEVILHKDPKISQPNPAGEGVICILTLISRLADILGGSFGACPYNASWKQE